MFIVLFVICRGWRAKNIDVGTIEKPGEFFVVFSVRRFSDKNPIAGFRRGRLAVGPRKRLRGNPRFGQFSEQVRVVAPDVNLALSDVGEFSAVKRKEPLDADRRAPALHLREEPALARPNVFGNRDFLGKDGHGHWIFLAVFRFGNRYDARFVEDPLVVRSDDRIAHGVIAGLERVFVD